MYSFRREVVWAPHMDKYYKWHFLTKPDHHYLATSVRDFLESKINIKPLPWHFSKQDSERGNLATVYFCDVGLKAHRGQRGHLTNWFEIYDETGNFHAYWSPQITRHNFQGAQLLQGLEEDDVTSLLELFYDRKTNDKLILSIQKNYVWEKSVRPDIGKLINRILDQV